jgi:hypothetical protein
MIFRKFAHVTRLLPCALVVSTASSAQAESIAQYARSTAKAAGILVEKERSFVNVGGSFTLYSVDENSLDPVFGLQLSFAPVQFFNVELGVGGNNNKVSAAVWNNSFSYVGAAIVYMFSTMAGGKPDFGALHDKLSIDVRTNPPYTNSAFWAGAYVTPLPFVIFQPQFGVHAVKVSVKNKGDNLRSYEATKILPTIGLESRGENSFVGFRLHIDPKTRKTIDPVTQKETSHNDVSPSFYLGANF